MVTGAEEDHGRPPHVEAQKGWQRGRRREGASSSSRGGEAGRKGVGSSFPCLVFDAGLRGRQGPPGHRAISVLTSAMASAKSLFPNKGTF